MKTINSAKKILKTLALAGALSLPFSQDLSAQEKPSLYVNYFGRYSSNSVLGVSNVPEYMRTVPEDSEDDQSDKLLLQETSAETCKRISLGGKVGARLPILNNTNFIFGLGLDYNFNARPSCVNKEAIDRYYKQVANSKPTCETPYITDVYFGVHPSYLFNSNRYVKPCIFSEIETKLSEYISVGFGCEVHPEKVIAENGWSKNNNSLQTKERYNLADLLIGSFYTSLKFSTKGDDVPLFYSLSGGLKKIINKDLTKDGRNLDINFDDSGWFIGFNVERKF